MADPITVTTNLDGEPEYAKRLGDISVHWANVEWQMYCLFEIMSGAPPAVSRSIFYSIESNRGKREILLAIANLLFNKQSEQTILDDILRRIGRTGRHRNKYVHDTWGVAETQKHEIFQLRMSGDTANMEEVTIPDMESTVENIKKLATELSEFRSRVLPRVPALLDKYRKLPGLGLVYSPKGHPPGRLPKGHRGRK